jgi:hypothetical protein
MDPVEKDIIDDCPNKFLMRYRQNTPNIMETLNDFKNIFGEKWNNDLAIRIIERGSFVVAIFKRDLIPNFLEIVKEKFETSVFEGISKRNISDIMSSSKADNDEIPHDILEQLSQIEESD